MSAPVAALVLMDWFIVAAYVALVVALGLYHKRKQKTANDYLLGGHRLPWWAIGVSLIATSFSSLSLLGIPEWGYTTRYLWLQLHIGELIALGVLSVTFLPFFARLNLTTAYEYLERRFGPSARVMASVIFHLQALARAGLFLFVTAAALATLTGMSVAVCILLVGISSMVYSSVGGLGAVVWTDAIQLLLVVLGVTACFLLIVGDLPGGLADIGAQLEGGERPVLIDLSIEPKAFPTLLTGLIAYGVLMLAIAGTNQQLVQRYLACSDLRSARRAAFLNWGIGTVTVALTLTLGIALRAWYGGTEFEPNTLLPTFIDERVPVGLAGLLVAAIFAASMSSIDSAIHSMATATLVDFVQRFRSRPMEDGARLSWARRLVWVYGVLAVIAAFIASQQNENVLQLLINWLMFLAGPMLGLFLLGMATRRVSEAAALAGVAVGYAAVAIRSFAPTWWEIRPFGPLHEVSGIWNALLGCNVCIAVAGVVAWSQRKRRLRPERGAGPGSSASA